MKKLLMLVMVASVCACSSTQVPVPAPTAQTKVSSNPATDEQVEAFYKALSYNTTTGENFDGINWKLVFPK